MEGKINNNGELYIKRGLGYRQQECKHKADLDYTACGDSCPLFGEPTFTLVQERMWPSLPAHYAKLELCGGKILYFTNFKDER